MQLSAFTGDWLLTRWIDDPGAGSLGRLEGTASFRPEAAGLAYREAGLLTLGTAPPVTVTRAYLWQAQGEDITIRFVDGQFFHAFAADAAEPEAEHACPPDFYRVRYDFRFWPRWRAEWRVTGPRKDYAMQSDYRRLDSKGEL